MVNETEVMLTGLSRSGNHAVVNWIWKQARGRKVLLNCCEGKWNPYWTCRPMDDGAAWWSTCDDFDLQAEKEGRFCRKDLFVHTYEDSFLAHVFGPVFQASHDAWVGRTRRRVEALVLRDPFNLLASRLSVGAGLPPRRAMKVWKQHAREFIGPPRHMRHERLMINYNRWVVSADYRRELAEALGIPFTDEGIDDVTPCHGGSSFDGMAFDGKARAMRVFDRWRAYADDPRWQEAFDDEVLDLAEAIFGPPPQQLVTVVPPLPVGRRLAVS